LHPKATPGVAVDANQRHLATAEQPHYNPQYRSRGLKTDDDPSTNPAGVDRRAPRLGGNGLEASERPTISQMVNRHADGQNEGRDWSRTTRISNDAANGTMRQAWAQRTQSEGRNTNADNQNRGMRTDVSGRNYTPRQNGNGGGQRGSNVDGGARNHGSGNSGSGGGARSASPSGEHRSGGRVAAPASAPRAPAPAPAPVSSRASKP
jgi:hypothetical protein